MGFTDVFNNMLKRRRHHSARALIRKLRPWQSEIDLVRLGPECDGGYLVPDDLDAIKACVSPGVSDQVGFDLAVAERGIDVYLADNSVAKPPVDHPRFIFTRKFVDTYNSMNAMRLDDWCAPLKAGRPDLLLQMDIEGAEMRVLMDMSDALLRQFRIMVIEFHDLDRIFDPQGCAQLRALMARLTRHHRVVHIHPNNHCPVIPGEIEVPLVMEFTFHRKDRARFRRSGTRTYPHPLDRHNAPQLPPLVLPVRWH